MDGFPILVLSHKDMHPPDHINYSNELDKEESILSQQLEKIRFYVAPSPIGIIDKHDDERTVDEEEEEDYVELEGHQEDEILDHDNEEDLEESDSDAVTYPDDDSMELEAQQTSFDTGDWA